MFKEKPIFQSQIPESLLEGVSPTEKWIMEEISKQGQAQTYLLDNQIKHGEILEDQNKKLETLDTKLNFTNGKIAAAILQIKDLEEKNKTKEDSWIELDKIISVKKFISKYLTNKYAIAIIVIFTIGCVRVFTSPEIQALLAKVLGFE